jgi:hypothetical protein
MGPPFFRTTGACAEGPPWKPRTIPWTAPTPWRIGVTVRVMSAMVLPTVLMVEKIEDRSNM